jgi:lysophospholipid acyltransferase (LPLAT)-like uncharacterized protein|uniref:lysophospholipid acyltransferase family protein n=2 Tax=Cephaloticoccus sp. TaxID=1985742 RepID=UPI00404B09BE
MLRGVNRNASVSRLAHGRLSPRTQVLKSNPTASDGQAAIQGITGWRRLVLWPFGMLLRLWGMSLRFEESAEDLRNYTKNDEPVSMVLWHNRLFLAAEIFRRYRQPRPMYALVSPSQDGAWLTAFFSLIGLRAVRGSSSNLGREAASALVSALRAGNDLGITPDGPRGPRYVFKPGALIVARRTKTPLLLIGADFESAWRFNKAWDRFYLPKPFSKVRMRCELVTAEQLADRDGALDQLQARLVELNPDRN